MKMTTYLTSVNTQQEKSPCATSSHCTCARCLLFDI